MPVNIEPIGLKVDRDEIGQYKVTFTNLWTPKDVHQAVTKIQQQYKLYRRQFVESLKKKKTEPHVNEQKGFVNAESNGSAD